MSGVPAAASTSTSAPARPLLLDDFSDLAAPGRVIGSSTRTGQLRHGSDAENLLSTHAGGLRIQPLALPGWNRAALRYGRFDLVDGMVLSATFCNGRNASTNHKAWPGWSAWLQQWVRGTQCDPPPSRMLAWPRFPRRDTVRRRITTARTDAGLADTDRSRFSIAFGWVDEPDDPLDGIVLATRATDAASSELVLVNGGEVTVLAPLLELPMRLALIVRGDDIVVCAAIDDGVADSTAPSVLAITPIGDGQRSLWATFDQRVVGELGFAADTRIREIRIDQLTAAAQAEINDCALGDPTPELVTSTSALVPPFSAIDLAGSATAPSPADGERPLALAFWDRFDAASAGSKDSGTLDGRAHDGLTWRHLVGERHIVPAPTGSAGMVVGPEVAVPTNKLVRLVQPSGQRTVYGVEWDGSSGAIETTITAPTGDDPSAERGRGGLVLYQDPDHYVLVNDWIDTAHAASVSVFWRTAGFEDVYDGMWAIVEDRLTWGAPHRLSVRFDRASFSVYLDGHAVIAREYAQLYPDAAPLDVSAVGICANWDFGDDTGSHFADFRAYREL